MAAVCRKMCGLIPSPSRPAAFTVAANALRTEDPSCWARPLAGSPVEAFGLLRREADDSPLADRAWSVAQRLFPGSG